MQQHPFTGQEAGSSRLCDKQGVARRFGAAREYHGRAVVQRQVAAGLMALLAKEVLPPAPRILEVGCGSGLLSQLLLEHYAQGWFCFSDLSLAMVQRAASRLGRGCFLAMDGEVPAVEGGFDLMVSSLAAQWFARPDRAIRHWLTLLRPGGLLALATLGEETFHQWRAACAVAGIPCATPVYPTPDQLAQWDGGQGQTCQARITVYHPSALSFFQGLRAVGAHGTREPTPPLSANQLRRALRAADAVATAEGVAMTYHVLYRLVQKR